MANQGMARIVALAGLLCAAFVGAGARAQDLFFMHIGGGHVGDGAPATDANLNGVGELVFDGTGNLYVSQSWGNRIRRISPDGTITTIVGGETGFAGDGGPAIGAKISQPRGLAFDALGNLYFSDAGNRRVRRIATDGTITTVAGSGGYVHSGDGGQATAAGIADPGGLAIDHLGNLYIADTVSQVVRKVTPAGVITTVAGTGVAGYSGDGGAATLAMLNTPMGLDVDAAGTLYIADTNNSAIRAVSTAGTISTLIAEANVMFPYNVTVGPDGAVYGSNTGSCTVFKVSGGTGTWVAGANGCDEGGENIGALYAPVGEVDGIAFDSAGNLYMADSTHDRVRRLTVATGLVHTFAGGNHAVAPGSSFYGARLSMGHGIAVNASGEIAFADALPHRRVFKVDAGNTHITQVAGNGLYEDVCGLPCGNALDFAFLLPVGTAFGPDGKVYVSDRGYKRVLRIEPTGALTVYAGSFATTPNDGGPATSAKVDANGIAFDAAGNLYIADRANHRIRKVDPSGIITTVAGTGTKGFSGDGGAATAATMSRPTAVAVDASGNVYFYDSDNRRLRRIAANGTIATIAGNGTIGLGGDGGVATNVELGSVQGIAVDASGVYVSAYGRIRRIAPNGTIDSIGGWSDYAMGLAIRNGTLYVTTQAGRVFSAVLSNASPRKVAHDFDGDGASDLFWRNVSTGANVLWRSANGATQTPVVGVTSQAWKVVGQGDFDGDGKADLFWRNDATGANTIWRSGSNATQIAVVAVTNQAWKVAAVGDFDGDGKSDLYWRNSSTGQNTIWRSGNNATQIAVNTTGLDWQVAGAGDFTADGKSDILWRNRATLANLIWKSGTATAQQGVASVLNTQWKVVGIGDFDGDHRADIFWRNTVTGANTIWNGAVVSEQTAVLTVANQQWRVQSVGDFDGDGRDDLVWRNMSTGGNLLWKSASGSTQQSMLGVTNFQWGITPQEFRY